LTSSTDGSIIGSSVERRRIKMSMMNKAAYAVAGLMMAHYENPIESPYEFLPEDEPDLEGVAEWIDDNIKDMYSEDSREFRESVLEEVRKQLKL